MQKKITHKRILIILLLAFFPVLTKAKTVSYQNLPDSLRMQIRLKSYLLISPANQSPGILLPGLDTEVPLAFYYNGTNPAEFIEAASRYCKNHSRVLVIAKSGADFPDSIKSEIIIYNPGKLDSLILAGNSANPFATNFCSTENELVMLDISNSGIESEEACFNLWQKQGKLPNLIRTLPSKFEEAARIISKLNSTGKIYGAVYENGQLLPDVFWENSPGVKTCGYFCFPLVSDNFSKLIPKKAGYRFSPDIILQSASNRNDMKIFNGIKHAPDFGLSDYFTFNKKVRNEIQGKNKEFIINNVKFIKDAEKGWVACFENRAYIDAGLQSNESLKSDFSVAAWIKPSKFNENNSILGKGKNFVLKIHNGKLTYTMTGIKDYISEKSPIPLNTWTHIAMTYSGFNNRIDFYLNGKHTDRMDLIADYAGSDYTLIIGSNLWEEFFTGSLGEIKIWDRELNEQEIQLQYSNPGHKNNLPWLLWIPVFIIAAGLGAFFAFRKRKIKKLTPQRQHIRLKNLETEIQHEGEKIICFGGLKVIDSNGNNVFQKFSPKLKQLFTLIFMYSLSEKKGITSKQLTEILWAGMSVANAKNSRGTYMQNLKSALAPFKTLKLGYSERLWSLNFEAGCYNEYETVKLILEGLYLEENAAVVESQLPPLLAILKKGRFLEGIEGSWLDPFIEKTDNRIIEFCLSVFPSLDNKKHTSLLFDLSEIISIYDPLNETALQKKIGLLVEQGKLSFAHSIYDNFVKLYKELYNEDYPIEFKDLVADNS